MQTRTFIKFLFSALLFILCNAPLLLQQSSNYAIAQEALIGSEDVSTTSQFYHGGVWRYFQVWPTKISPGDRIYFCSYDLNTADSLFSYPENSQIQQTIVEAVLSIPGRKSLEYPEKPVVINVCPTPNFMFDQQNPNAPKLCNIRPGERSIIASRAWELPLTLNNVFDDTSGEIVCELSISTYDVFLKGNKTEPRNYKFTVHLTPRIEKESNVIAKWKTQSDDLKQSSNNSYSYTDDEETSSHQNLRFLVNPNFDYSNPNLVEENWAEIEAQVQPGVLRDEIHFARTLVSYFTEANDQNAVSKRNEFVSWFISRPEPLRYKLIDRFYVLTQIATKPHE